jgi:hypothetical protein
LPDRAANTDAIKRAGAYFTIPRLKNSTIKAFPTLEPIIATKAPESDNRPESTSPTANDMATVLLWDKIDKRMPNRNDKDFLSPNEAKRRLVLSPRLSRKADAEYSIP